MRVLLPLDGSEFSKSVVGAARRFLEVVPGSEFYLMTVLDPRSIEGKHERPTSEPLTAAAGGSVVSIPAPVTVETHGEAMARTHAESEDWLHEFMREHFPGAPITPRVEWSRKPVQKIVEVADELDIDVILMPTHGRSGLSHMVTGSVTEGVIRSAGRPVLVVGPRRESGD